MIHNIEISNFQCDCVPFETSNRIVYLIYPELAEFNGEWLEKMSEIYKISVVAVYVPADQWNDALTPWPEPGEAKGCPPFAGKSKEFLNLLKSKILPLAEKTLGNINIEERNLIGVSLSGLFTLWQWMLCDTFRSIGCLSGSFWFNGFIDWFDKQPVPHKTGKAFFLLGEEEPHAHVKAFQSVGVNTETIMEKLKESGIKVTFEWVSGNHFSRPVHRAEKAFNALFS